MSDKNKGFKTTCASCGAEVLYTNRDVLHDYMGDFIECPNCHATFDVDYSPASELLNEDASKRFKEIDSKQVPDADGFMTDYTLYYDTLERNICMYIWR